METTLSWPIQCQHCLLLLLRLQKVLLSCLPCKACAVNAYMQKGCILLIASRLCIVQRQLNQAGSCWCLVFVQDIERGAVDTQLIAHDREVYDIAWGGVGVFATVSADGSVRVFDLRCDEITLLSRLSEVRGSGSVLGNGVQWGAASSGCVQQPAVHPL